MPHFFINSNDVKNNKIEFSQDYKHLVKALRLRIGEKLLLIDENKIQYETKVAEIKPDSIVADIEKQYLSTRELDFELHLAQSPLRSDAQNLVVEKATELGIHTLHPIYTDNCALAKNSSLAKNYGRIFKTMRKSRYSNLYAINNSWYYQHRGIR